MTEPDDVRAQYASETNLETRRSVWRPGPSGVDLQDLVLSLVREGLPPTGGMPDVLEVGCGTGAFAARLAAELPGVALLAVDTSHRMVELTRERGLLAQLQDVQHLLAPDAAYDVVLAFSMLYHVPDLDRGLAEVRRVLRPTGRFVAVTVSDEHAADLRRDAGGEAVHLTFSRENGEEALLRHFDTVERTDLETRAHFADRAAALAYLDSFDEDLTWNPPAHGWPRDYAGHPTVFVAS
jgi:SAM-dependent methyltransferase